MTCDLLPRNSYGGLGPFLIANTGAVFDLGA